MEYKNFLEQVKEQIKDFLPEKFADADVIVNQVVKNNVLTRPPSRQRNHLRKLPPILLRFRILHLLRPHLHPR